QKSLPVELADPLPKRKSPLPVLHGFSEHLQYSGFLFQQACAPETLCSLTVTKAFEIVPAYRRPFPGSGGVPAQPASRFRVFCLTPAPESLRGPKRMRLRTVKQG